MVRNFRFVWDTSKGRFAPPHNLLELPPADSLRDKLFSLADTIERESGGSQWRGLTLIICHFLLLIALMVIYVLVENQVSSHSSGIILLFAPFISFIPIVYAMVRERPADKLNRYLEEHMEFINADLRTYHFMCIFLFIPDADLHGKPFGFCQRVVLGRNFSGYIEFEERETLSQASTVQENKKFETEQHDPLKLLGKDATITKKPEDQKSNEIKNL